VPARAVSLPAAKQKQAPLHDDDDEDSKKSAVAMAVLYERGSLLSMLKPDPAVDDFEDLWSDVADPEALSHLAAIQTPRDWSKAILGNLGRLFRHFGSFSARQCLEQLSLRGARLTVASDCEIKSLRREILSCEDEIDCRWGLRCMSWLENCAPDVHAELARTPSMQARVASLHVKNSSSPPRPAGEAIVDFRTRDEIADTELTLRRGEVGECQGRLFA
jgi:hypothetical protein